MAIQMNNAGHAAGGWVLSELDVTQRPPLPEFQRNRSYHKKFAQATNIFVIYYYYLYYIIIICRGCGAKDHGLSRGTVEPAALE
jgi:hypothetical protein